jgi:hypothetical protein
MLGYLGHAVRRKLSMLTIPSAFEDYRPVALFATIAKIASYFRARQKLRTPQSVIDGHFKRPHILPRFPSTTGS